MTTNSRWASHALDRGDGELQWEEPLGLLRLKSSAEARHRNRDDGRDDGPFFLIAVWYGLNNVRIWVCLKIGYIPNEIAI